MMRKITRSLQLAAVVAPANIHHQSMRVGAAHMVTTSMMPVVLFLLVFMLGPRCAQAQSPSLQQLNQQQPKAPFFSALTQWSRPFFPPLLPQRPNNPVGIYVVVYPAEEPAKPAPLLPPDACKALPRRFPHPVI